MSLATHVSCDPCMTWVMSLVTLVSVMSPSPLSFLDRNERHTTDACQLHRKRQFIYRKIPKNFGHPKTCCNHPKTWTRWLYLWVLHPKDAEGIANSAPLGAVSTVCPGLSVRKLRIITLYTCEFEIQAPDLKYCICSIFCMDYHV